MIPDLSEPALNELKSATEANAYRALRDQLSDDYVFFFQIGWILRRAHDQACDGETDFLVCHSKKGYLCIEVKGGSVGFNAQTGEWRSIDGNDVKHRIKDPVAQALRAKYSVLSKLNEHPRWAALGIRNVVRGHAIFFRNIGQADTVARPDLPSSLVRTEHDLKSTATVGRTEVRRLSGHLVAATLTPVRLRLGSAVVASFRSRHPPVTRRCLHPGPRHNALTPPVFPRRLLHGACLASPGDASFSSL